MAKIVQYIGKEIKVSTNNSPSSVIYSRPGDTIKIDGDISGFTKEVVRGDLIIHMLNGNKITIANYALMLLEPDAPVLEDINKVYNSQELLSSRSPVFVPDSSTSQVVERRLSSADNSEPSGQYLATSETVNQEKEAKEKSVGQTQVPDQEIVPLANTDTLTYQQKTLLYSSKSKLNSDTFYLYNGKTLHNQDQIGDDDLLYDLVRPTVEGLYGASSQGDGIAETGTGNYLKMLHGGGSLPGNENVSYQYNPETKSYRELTSGMTYIGDETGDIYRGIQVSLPNNDTQLQIIRISGLPEGVSIESQSGQVVTRIGTGAYRINLTSNSPTANLKLKYTDELSSQMSAATISIEGYNDKTETLVSGSTKAVLDFRLVNGSSDIANFSAINTFTFSTKIDPLIVRLTEYSDIVRAGKSTYTTYYMGGGNDIFYQGTGFVEVHMEAGNNTAYIGSSDGYFDGTGGGNNTLRLLETPNVDILGEGGAMVLDQEGIIRVNTNLNGAVYRNVAKNIKILFFDNRDNRDNTVRIETTAGYDGLELRGMGGNNTLNFTTGQEVLINLYNSGESAFVSTNAGNDKVYLGADNSINIFNLTQASKGSLLGSLDYNVTVNFNPSGLNTVRYDNLAITTTGITYYAGSFAGNQADTVVKPGGENQDIIRNVTEIYGTRGADTFYGSGSSRGVTYQGYVAPGNGDNELSYKYETENGVEIDLTNSQTVVIIKKSNGQIDKAYLIGKITASNADDIFYLSDDTGNNIDGLGGDADTLSYKRSTGGQGVIINIQDTDEYGVQGNVSKSGGSFTDIYKNINIFEGTGKGDTFLVSVFNKELKLNGVYNSTLSYTDRATGEGNDILPHSLTLNLPARMIEKGAFKDSIEGFTKIALNSAVNKLVFNNLNDLNGYQKIDMGSGNDNVIDIYQSVSTETFLLEMARTVFNYAIVNLKQSGNTIGLPSNQGNLRELNATYEVGKANKLSLNIYNEAEIDVTGTTGSNPQAKITGKQLGLPDNVTSTTGFTNFIGATGVNTFKENADSSVLHNYSVSIGDGGKINLDYSTTQNIYLKFDFALQGVSGYGVSVDKGNSLSRASTSQDLFTSANDVKGGNGGNIFILNPNSPVARIVGGNGYDTVSFENSNYAISSLPSTGYENIDEIKLTRLNDSISHNDDFFTSTDKKYTVDAGGGDKNRFSLSTINQEINFYVGVLHSQSGSLAVKLASSETEEDANKIAYIKNFQLLQGSSAKTTGFYVKIDDNDQVSTGKTMYYLGGHSSATDVNGDYIKYDGLKEGVTVSFINNDPVTEDPLGSSIQITKRNGSIDYISHINKITLSSGVANTVKLDLSYVNGYANTQIDMGISGENKYNTLDLSTNVSIIMDMADKSVSGSRFNISNYNKILGTSGTDTYKMDNADINYNITSVLGKVGQHKVDYSQVTIDLVFNVDQSKVQRGSREDSLEGFTTYVGGKGNNTFNGSEKVQATYEGKSEGNNKSTLNYGDIQSTEVSGGYTFFLRLADKGGYLYKDQEGSNRDIFSNISKIIANKGDTTFNVTKVDINASSIMSIDGGISGRNTLVFGDTSYTSGVIFDMLSGLASENQAGIAGAKLLEFSNMHVIKGSSVGSDIFKIPDIGDFDIFTGTSQIDGLTPNSAEQSTITISSGTIVAKGNTIDMSKSKAGHDYTVDLAVSKIMLTENSDKSLSYNNIQTILLGEGDDTLILGASTSTVRKVDGGGGSNTISFKNALSPITGNISNLQVGAQSLEITNFKTYRLSDYNDEIEVSAEQNASLGISVDGGEGEDTITYKGFSGVTIDVIAAREGWLKVNRGSTYDEITNFQNIAFDKDSDNVINLGNEKNSISFSGGRKNEIGYKDYTTGKLSLDISGGVVERNRTDGLYIQNKIENISKITLGNTEDSLYLANKVAGSANITEVTIDASNGGSKTVSFSGANVDYTESITSSGGATAQVGEVTYNIIGDGVKFLLGNSAITSNFKSALKGHNFYGYSDADKLSYENLSSGGVTVDFGRSEVYLTGNDSIKDHFSNISEIKGTNHGNNKFLGLSNSRSYNIEAGGSGNTVGYSGSLVGLTFIITNSQTKIFKDGVTHESINDQATLQDSLTGIDGYEGSNLNDTFIVDLSYFASHQNSLLDGKGGTNTLRINSSEGLTIKFENEGAGTINDTRFNIKSFQNFKLSNSDDTVSFVAGSLAMGLDGDVGNNIFNFSDKDSSGNSKQSISTLSYDYANLSANLTGAANSGNYSISLQKFQTLNFKGNNSNGEVTFILNNFNATNQSSFYNNRPLAIDFSTIVHADGSGAAFITDIKSPENKSFVYENAILRDKDTKYLSVKNAGYMNLTAGNASNIYSKVDLEFKDKGSTTHDSTIALGNGFYNLLLAAINEDIELKNEGITLGRTKITLSNLPHSSLVVSGSMKVSETTQIFSKITSQGNGNAIFDMLNYQGTLGSLIITSSGYGIDRSLQAGGSLPPEGDLSSTATRLSGFQTVKFGGYIDIQSIPTIKIIGNGTNIAKIDTDAINPTNITYNSSTYVLQFQVSGSIRQSTVEQISILDFASSINTSRNVTVTLNTNNTSTLNNINFNVNHKNTLAIAGSAIATFNVQMNSSGLMDAQSGVYGNTSITGIKNISILDLTANKAQTNATTLNTINFYGDVASYIAASNASQHTYIKMNNVYSGSISKLFGARIDFRGIQSDNSNDVLYLVSTSQGAQEVGLKFNNSSNYFLTLSAVNDSYIYLPDITTFVEMTSTLYSNGKGIFGSKTADSIFIFNVTNPAGTNFAKKSQGIYPGYQNFNILLYSNANRATFTVAPDGFNDFNNNVMAIIARPYNSETLSLTMGDGKTDMAGGLVLTKNIGERDSSGNNIIYNYAKVLMTPEYYVNGTWTDSYVNAAKALFDSGKYYISLGISDYSSEVFLSKSISEQSSYQNLYAIYVKGDNLSLTLKAGNTLGFGYGKTANTLLLAKQYSQYYGTMKLINQQSASAKLTLDGMYADMNFLDGSTIPDQVTLAYEYSLNGGVNTSFKLLGFLNKTYLNTSPAYISYAATSAGGVGGIGNFAMVGDFFRKNVYENFSNIVLDAQSLQSETGLNTFINLLDNTIQRSQSILITIQGISKDAPSSFGTRTGQWRNTVNHKNTGSQKVDTMDFNIFNDDIGAGGLAYTLQAGSNSDPKNTPITIINSYGISLSMAKTYNINLGYYYNFDKLNGKSLTISVDGLAYTAGFNAIINVFSQNDANGDKNYSITYSFYTFTLKEITKDGYGNTVQTGKSFTIAMSSYKIDINSNIGDIDNTGSGSLEPRQMRTLMSEAQLLHYEAMLQAERDAERHSGNENAANENSPSNVADHQEESNSQQGSSQNEDAANENEASNVAEHQEESNSQQGSSQNNDAANENAPSNVEDQQDETNSEQGSSQDEDAANENEPSNVEDHQDETNSQQGSSQDEDAATENVPSNIEVNQQELNSEEGNSQPSFRSIMPASGSRAKNALSSDETDRKNEVNASEILKLAHKEDKDTADEINHWEGFQNMYDLLKQDAEQMINDEATDKPNEDASYLADYTDANIHKEVKH